MPTDAEVLLCIIISVSVVSGAEAAGRNGQGISPGRGPDPQTRHHVLRVHNSRQTRAVASGEGKETHRWCSSLDIHPSSPSTAFLGRITATPPPTTSVSSRLSGTNYTAD